MARKTVFLTGATGNMGWAAVQEILKKPNKINLRILARKGAKNEDNSLADVFSCTDVCFLCKIGFPVCGR